MERVTLDEVFQLAARDEAAGQKDLATRLFVVAERFRQRDPVKWSWHHRAAAEKAAASVARFCLTS